MDKENKLLFDQINNLTNEIKRCVYQNDQLNREIESLKLFLKQVPVTELQFQKKMLDHFEHCLRSIQNKYKYWRMVPKSWAYNSICRRLRKNIKHLEAFQCNEP
jgi:hypothetical protein